MVRPGGILLVSILTLVKSDIFKSTIKERARHEKQNIRILQSEHENAENR